MKTTYYFLLFGFSTLIFNSCKKDNNPSISEQEKNDLLFLIEEEKLARDVYDHCYEMYGQSIFNNISNSEDSHISQVSTLLDYYHIENPIKEMNSGEFLNSTLQSTYNDLIAQSHISLIEALKVGATIEDMDILDIKAFYAHTNKVDILSVYDFLTCGSRNHLRSFVNQLNQNGTSYSPQYLNLDEYNSIINSDKENCSVN